MRLAIVLVHYRTPQLAADAVAALVADLEQSRIEARCIVVDNGNDKAGRAVLSALPVDLVEPGENLGYAGGINLGVAQTDADALVLMNADVLVLPGCLAALLGVLKDGAACAGPCFFWDRTRRLLLPPTELRHRRAELLALQARRGGTWAARARRRSRRHSLRHWQAPAPLASYALSGSLLAVRRSAWERVGGFDRGYQLYFEETDWLLRLRRAGLGAFYVPGAEAIHLYAQSSLVEPAAAGWFEASAHRFRERAYGPRFAAALERGAAKAVRVRRGWGSADIKRVVATVPLNALGSEPAWVEVSPNPSGFPAAAEKLGDRPGATWELPREISHRLAPGSRLWARVCDQWGGELSCHLLATPGMSRHEDALPSPSSTSTLG